MNAKSTMDAINMLIAYHFDYDDERRYTCKHCENAYYRRVPLLCSDTMILPIYEMLSHIRYGCTAKDIEL